MELGARPNERPRVEIRICSLSRTTEFYEQRYASFYAVPAAWVAEGMTMPG